MLTPDFVQLYGIDDSSLRSTIGHSFQAPVVIVAGVAGSTLTDPSGREAWFGSISRMVFSNYVDMALEIDADGTDKLSYIKSQWCDENNIKSVQTPSISI